jgi:hypothetical protein
VVVIVIGVILTLGMFARSRQQAAHAHAPTTIEVRTNHSQQLQTVTDRRTRRASELS